MLTGVSVAKERKPKPGSQDESVKPEVGAADPEGGEMEYTEHLLVPLGFKQRLDQIAFRVNQDRKRNKKSKLPLGWFVVTGLADWMAQMEAEMNQSPPK